MQICLKLGRHCIETASKREYEHLISQYFRASDNKRPAMEPVINALSFFLENADFSDLRARMERKGTDSSAMAVLKVPDLRFDQMHIRFSGQDFHPVWKNIVRD